MGCGERCGGCFLEHLGKGLTQVEVGARYYSTGLLIVAEASGENEARESLPLRPHAPAGAMFSRIMRQAQIERSEVAITNVLRCQPPGNVLEGAWYQFGATSQCLREYLIPTIEHLKPRAILALGGIAYRLLTDAPKGRYGTLDYVRGYVMRGSGAAAGVPVIPTYHPSYLRQGKPHLMTLVERDLKRAFRVATGRMVEERDFFYDLRQDTRLRYQTTPTVAEAWEWVQSIDESSPLSWDLETKVSALEDEDERLPSHDAVRLFQATQRRGEGIAIPYRDEYQDAARAILMSRTRKIGFNLWRYDELVAQANKIEINTELGSDDAMVMFGRWQPDLPANLQTAAQFCGFPAPWKHLNDVDEEFYGVADADAALCVWEVAGKALRDLGAWDWYENFHAKFWPILRRMSERGHPISEEHRGKLLRTLERFEHTNLAHIRRQVPENALTLKKPYLKTRPKDFGTDNYVEWEIETDKETKCQFCVKNVTKTTAKVARGECVVCAGTGIMPKGTKVPRWARRMEFNPNSKNQVIKLIKSLGHTVPKHQKRVDENGEKSDTTEVKELERLATKTRHPVYALMIRDRQITKSKGTYYTGYAPAMDGAVHPKFTFRPATGQLSTIDPNGQNQPKRGRSRFQKLLVGRFRSMIRARPGRMLVSHDWSAFHALTTGFEANSELYMRIARNDMHSFVTVHWLKLPEREGLLNRDDADMAGLFKWLRKNHAGFDQERQKCKAVDLGIGFGQRPKSIFEMYREDFERQAEVQTIWDLLMVDLFPDVAGWQRRTVQEAHEQGFLQCRSGAIRWFCEAMRWDHRSQKFVHGDQAEQAIAFRPANDAFLHCRWVMRNMEERGMPERYRLFNNVHDSLEHEPDVELVSECVREVKAEMERPSPFLVSRLVPDGLVVRVEASTGTSMADMH